MIWVFRENLSLYFEGSPQQKIPRELHGGGDPVIFLHSHVPMERCFDGTNQENSRKTRNKEWRKEKEEIFDILIEVLILMCSPSVRNALVQPSLRRTSPTLLQHELGVLIYLFCCNLNRLQVLEEVLEEQILVWQLTANGFTQTLLMLTRRILHFFHLVKL